MGVTHRDFQEAQDDHLREALQPIGIDVLDHGLGKLERLVEMYSAQAKNYGCNEAGACLDTALAAVEDSRSELTKVHNEREADSGDV